MIFERNEFSYTGFYTVFPILLVFFLVGAISLLEPKDIDARIGISIGIFAFVFAYVSIVTDLKPQYVKSLNIVTLADMMLKVLLIATTTYTISSVIGYSLAKTIKENTKQWIKRIHTLRTYDILATVFAEIIVIQFLIHYIFSIDWFNNDIIMIVGLAWGIFIHLIYIHTAYRGKSTYIHTMQRYRLNDYGIE